MKTQTSIKSPFDWRGESSIFTKGTHKSKQTFNGANVNRAAAQIRLEPRPTYLISDSVYLKQPKISKCHGK